MSATLGQRYLTVLVFEVDGHRFGLDASEVTEVVRAVLPSRLAQAPDVIEGVINVRGRLAPVLDLRARFALTRRELQASDVFLLCECAGRLLALHADAALDLLQVAASELAPRTEVTRAALYARGMTTLPDGLLFLCDLRAFLQETELLALERALASATHDELSA